MQFQAWAPDLYVVTYIGPAAAREVIRTQEFGSKPKKLEFNVLLTTYELVLRDSKELGDIKWQVLAVDEVEAPLAVFFDLAQSICEQRHIVSRTQKVSSTKRSDHSPPLANS